LLYSWFQIIHFIETTNWRKDIFDYLEYVIDSFGEFPKDLGEPLYLSYYIEELRFLVNKQNSNLTKLSSKDVKKRFNEVNEYLKKIVSVSKKGKDSDLSVLIKTYENWFKIFPFEISFFTQLKAHYKKNIPIFNGKPSINKYTGKAKFTIHTKNTLIKSLLNTTDNLITQINTSTLFEKGLLTEPDKIKLELIVSERKQKLKQGYVNNSQSEETRYRNILKDWFKDEEKFINKITPFVKDLTPQPIYTLFEFVNLFDTVNTDKIYTHFKTGLVDNKMLTKEELENYIKAAFENKQPPKNLFNIKNAPSKDKVMKVFYEYYKNIAGKPHGKQKEYAGLLGNYFQGFKTSTVSSNFSKSIY